MKKHLIVLIHTALLGLLVAASAGCSTVPNQLTSIQETQKPTEGIVSFEPTVVILNQTSEPLPHESVEPKTQNIQEKPTVVPPYATGTPDVRLDPKEWKSWPVIPTFSKRALQILEMGIKEGRNPRAFSKAGDCESVTEWFLADFDKGPEYYKLGEYQDLQGVIDFYPGSYRRISLAARPGYTAASLLSPLVANKELCKKNESPLACEFREHNPSVLIITLGTNDAVKPESFESNMKKVIEYTISQGVLPILSTKADNIETDHSINAAMAGLAHEYDLPLWNFWAAVQPLYRHGLQDDGAHLTWSPNDFSDPANLKRAWPVRNLNALQVLEALQEARLEQNSNRTD